MRKTSPRVTRRQAFEDMLNDITKMQGKTNHQFDVRSLLLHQAVALVKSEGYKIFYNNHYYVKNKNYKLA